MSHRTPIYDTICVSRLQLFHSPPTSYTNALKVPAESASTATADNRHRRLRGNHLIPLSLGGSPTSPQNLWPQPRYEVGRYAASDKDTVEYKLYKAVCAGTVQLAPAQQAIATAGPPRCPPSD